MATTSLFNGLDAELVVASQNAIAVSKNEINLREPELPLLMGLERVHGKGKPSKTGAQRWAWPMPVGEHSDPTEQVTGYEENNLSVTGVSVPAAVRIFETLYPIVVSEREVDDAGGDAGAVIFDLSDERSAAVASRAKRDFEKHLTQGSVAGWDNCNTLNGDDNSTGILESDVRGSQTNTVCGFVKSTYSDVPGCQNDRYDFNSSFNSTGIIGLATIEANAKARTRAPSKDLIDICSVLFFAQYKNAVGAYERYAVVGKQGDEGTAIDALSMNLLIGGVPVLPSIYMPNAGSATTASPWSYLRLNARAILFWWGVSKARNGYFGVRPFEAMGPQQRVIVAPLLVRGQLIAQGFGGSAIGIEGEA